MHMCMIRQPWPYLAFSFEFSRAPYRIDGDGIASHPPNDSRHIFINAQVNFERKRRFTIEQMRALTAPVETQPIDMFAIWIELVNEELVNSRWMIAKDNVLTIAPTLFGHVERHTIKHVLKMFAQGKYVVPDYVA